MNDIRTNDSGRLNIRENLGANSLLNSFDLFYYMNRRSPFTTGDLYVLDGEKLDQVKGEKLNIKELYKKFRGSNSYGLLSLPFLCTLNLFLGGKEKTSKAAMIKLYSNLTLSILSSNDYLKFQALTDIFTEINLRFNNSIFANNSREK